MTHRWLGRWLMWVGVVHIAFGLLRYRGEFAAVMRDGLWNSLGGRPERELAFWFVVSGWGMFFGGGLLDRLEAGQVPLPGWSGWALLSLVGIGIVLMPVSGFWALLPPAIGALRRSARRIPEVAVE